MLDNDRKSEHPFRKYARIKEIFGEQTYKNIIDSVNSVKEVTLPEFIEALGIGRVGRTAADIVAIAPTVDDIDRLTVQDVANIPGFALIKAQGFIDGWKSVRGEIEQLLKYVTIKVNSCSSDKLVGKSFCFTGSFSNPTRGEMEKMVTDHGGKISSVSKNLTGLVWDGAISGGKLEKAQKIGVNILSQDDFLKLLN
jgi:DNA ligase (NAD+)